MLVVLLRLSEKSLVMTLLLRKPLMRGRLDCKGFAATGKSDGTNTRVCPDGNGPCSLPSILRSITLRVCVLSTLKRIDLHIIPSLRRNHMQHPSEHQLTILKKR